MVRLNNTISTGGSATVKVLKNGDGVEDPFNEIGSQTLNFGSIVYTANSTLTADFTSATFSSGDVLGISFTPSHSPSTNIDLNMTIVIAYDELS